MTGHWPKKKKNTPYSDPDVSYQVQISPAIVDYDTLPAYAPQEMT